MRLAVIPARGGSKRIPRKNIKLFGGIPMIAWSIRAAINSGCFDRIIVSTDDHEIMELAKEYGADAPFLRPAELSDDHTGTIPVIAHAINWQNKYGSQATEVCCIYATAPFVRASDLKSGLELLLKSGAYYAFTVTTYAFPIQRAVRIASDGRVNMFDPKHFSTRSQDLEEAYHDAGQFYWGKADAWLKGKPLFDIGSIPIIIPRYMAQDIDTKEDWKFAELLFLANEQLGK